jgi:subfamily B ATP-binding cassette protein MsbA
MVQFLRSESSNHLARSVSLQQQGLSNEAETARTRGEQLQTLAEDQATRKTRDMELVTLVREEISQRKERLESAGISAREKRELKDSIDQMNGWLQGRAASLGPAQAERYLTKIKGMLPSVNVSDSALLKILIIFTIPLAMLFRGVCTYLNIYMMSWVSIRAVSDLRTRLFSHLVNLSLNFFSKVSTGELITRFQDIVIIQNSISTSLTTLVKAPVTIISLSTFLIMQQPKLTAVALLTFPLFILPVVIYGKKLRRSALDFQNQSVGMGKLMYEAFTGTRIVKAYNLEDEMVGQYRKSASDFIRHYMKMVRATEIPGPLIEFFGSLGVAIFFLYLVFGNITTPGNFLGFIGSIFLMYEPIKQLTRLHNQVEQARVICEGVFKILDTKTTVPDPENPLPLNAVDKAIHFENVSFRYEDTKKAALRNLNLTVKGGSMVALVGSSGSGKTTITNLLLRFYDPQEGRVTIGGTDIRQVTQKDLRSQIAVVTQDTILFNETIFHNIQLGRPGATEAEVEAASKHAHAFEFIAQKPKGFKTLVGEKGVNVSGGQKQRIAIARAILKDAPILILDEATNALDTASERAVQSALEELMVGRTTICIAHRLSTVQKADQIVVMSEGQIVEMGTHDELMQKGGHYRKLYEMQFQEA